MRLGHTLRDSRRKYPELSDSLLQELQNWGQRQGLPKISEEQLALFAHSCYFNVENTIRCMSIYYKMKSTVPEFFSNRDADSQSLQQCLKVVEFIPLPLPDRNGNRIIFHRLLDPRPNQYTFKDSVKLLLMTIDWCLYTEGCCSGFVFLFDMQGVRLGHLTRLSISSLSKFFEYVQEAIPLRLKAIYVVNAVWFVDKILALIKPFMWSELFDMLHLYPGDFSEVCEHIPPECLPSDLGGELDSTENLREKNRENWRQLKEYFAQDEEFCRNYTPEPGKSASNGKRRVLQIEK